MTLQDDVLLSNTKFATDQRPSNLSITDQATILAFCLDVKNHNPKDGFAVVDSSSNQTYLQNHDRRNDSLRGLRCVEPSKTLGHSNGGVAHQKQARKRAVEKDGARSPTISGPSLTLLSSHGDRLWPSSILASLFLLLFESSTFIAWRFHQFSNFKTSWRWFSSFLWAALLMSCRAIYLSASFGMPF